MVRILNGEVRLVLTEYKPFWMSLEEDEEWAVWIPGQREQQMRMPCGWSILAVSRKGEKAREPIVRK